jgi:hypothetical protein
MCTGGGSVGTNGIYETCRVASVAADGGEGGTTEAGVGEAGPSEAGSSEAATPEGGDATTSDAAAGGDAADAGGQ